MATASHAARQVKNRALTARSIRVLVTPTPITFAERRSVLQVLEQFGPIEVFKMSPGTYSNFISATREESTAQRLVSSSPLTYTLVEPPRRLADDIHVADLVEPESFASGQPSVRVLPSSFSSSSSSFSSSSAVHARQAWAGKQGQDQGREPEQEQREFKLEIFPAPEFRHRFAMAGSPLHGAWPGTYKADRSFAATTLKQTIPHTMVGKGLAHWLVSPGLANRGEGKLKRLTVKNVLPSNMKKPAAE